MPGGSRHAPKPRGAAGGGRSPQTTPRRTVKTGAAAGAASVDEARIADVIRPVIAAAGLDLEAVRVSAAGRRRLLRVVVDSDRGVSLDDAADVSRELSAALDAAAVMGDFPYTLEVSSPGGVTLDVEGARRLFPHAVLGPGAIQVEFGHPPSELGATGDGH